MPPKYGTLRERFFSKVSRDESGRCWLWTGTGPRGYGMIRPTGAARGASKLYAHRVSWELHYGPIPDGKHVLHRCDNPSCVNPEHLFLGTHADNMADKVSKGRQNTLRGEAVKNSKLTEKEVLEIRSSGLPYTRLAKLYDVSDVQISNICRRKQWAHV